MLLVLQFFTESDDLLTQCSPMFYVYMILTDIDPGLNLEMGAF